MPASETASSTTDTGWDEGDVARAVEAARKAGLTDYRIEIAPDGTISIIVGNPGGRDSSSDPAV